MVPSRVIDYEVVRAIGLTLPDVTDASGSRGTALKLEGKLLACKAIHKSAEPQSLMVRISLKRREELLAQGGEAYYLTDHYAPYPAILVRLSRIKRTSLQELLTESREFVLEGTKTTAAIKRRAVWKSGSDNAVLARLRSLCLALPETSEASSWNHPNFRAGRRTFVTYETVDERPTIAFRLESDEVRDFLGMKGFVPTPYGRGAWVSLDTAQRFSWRLVEALVERSYRTVALKRMTDRLDRTRRTVMKGRVPSRQCE